jgi:signal transduction histidine kinase
VATPRTASVQRGITVLLAVMAVAFVVLLLLIEQGWSRQVDLLLGERVKETERVLHRVLELRANDARVHVDDYTRWDDFVTFIRRRDAHWADINITQSIATFGLNAAWVLNERFDLIFATNPTGGPGVDSLPVSREVLRGALRAKRVNHFFAWTAGGLIEVWTSPIQPSEDFNRMAPVHGYYVVGRVWTRARMSDLGRDTEAAVDLLPLRRRSPPPTVSGRTGLVTVSVPLTAVDGSTLAAVRFQTRYPLVSRVFETLRASVILLVGGSLAIVLGLGLALSRWVARPLAGITEALRRQDRGLLGPSLRRHDELGQLARAVEEFFNQRLRLIEALEAADGASNAKSQFLANISHELRTPMHGILSYARFGLREAMSGEREVLLDDFTNIEECGTSLLALLNDLLDLSKLEAGHMRFEFEDVSLPEIVADALDEFASLYHDKSLRSEIVADGAPESVRADPHKIQQVLRNLLSNAAKFSPAGGLVTVRIETAGPMARVSVEDRGGGIPSGEAELIFDKFVQASNAASRTGGTGLGLAICFEIVEGHYGSIWAENRPEGGARLTFELPIAGPAAELLDPSDHDGSAESTPPKAPTSASMGKAA